MGLVTDLHRQNRYKEISKNFNEFESPRHFVMHGRVFNNECLTTCMYMNIIKDTVDKDTFTTLIEHPELAFVGDHDNIPITVFLEFLSKAWNLQSDF